ncbi:hypothetical protein ACPA54_37550 [Uniformispora flossi]|uniref:hypothetical protein n=1 Tax=Uniformispora flossi TaxID=3390723 RepID=UPI003C2FAD2B
MAFDQPIPPATAPGSEPPTTADVLTAPQVGRPARLLAWLAIGVPGLITLGVCGAVALSPGHADHTAAGLPFLVVACLPLLTMVPLLRIGGEQEFRSAALALAVTTVIYAFFTSMFAVGFLYLPSVALLVLAWAATYGPARIRSNAAAIAGVVLAGFLAYFIGASLIAGMPS